MRIRVTKIQRFCLDDGPGVRSVIFLKGCTICCPWCCNPENLSYEKQMYYLKEKCSYNKGYEKCTFNLRYSEKEQTIRKNYDESYREFKYCKAIGIYGEEFDVDSFLRLIELDIIFFRNKKELGGITFSGGEPLSYDLSEYLNEIKKREIDICVETSLYFEIEKLKRSVDFIDNFIIDVKILEEGKARDLIKGDYNIFIRNLEELLKFKNSNNLLFRFCVVKDFTYTNSNIKNLINFLNNYNIREIEIFSVHNFAKAKYLSLGLSYNEFSIIGDEELNELKYRIEAETKTLVKINKII